MLRFPNPGSTISNFVAVYTAAFERLHDRVVSLDDIVEATVQANLATSCGHVGAEAISRSTRLDRTRDPLYNQLKMYAELFRSLGWLHPTEQSALNYTFTLLGRQIVAAGQHYLPLFAETVLGIAYPSYVLTVQGDQDLRPIAFLLRTMLASDGALSRDEMIVGPLSTRSDRGAGAADEIATLVRGLRKNSTAIQNALNQLSERRRIQINTLRNYTRWPIAIMRDCGWTEKVRLQFKTGSGSFEAHELTGQGRAVARRIVESADIRVDQVNPLPFDEKAALCLRAHYAMLERSGFDVAQMNQQLAPQMPLFNQALDRLGIERTQSLLFSPFQSMSPTDINKIFSDEIGTHEARERESVVAGAVAGRGSRDHLFIEPRLVQDAHGSTQEGSESVEMELRTLWNQARSAESAAEAFASAHVSDTKVQFYPLVSGLFKLLGLKSDYSRPGVNYQRWDACVWLDETAVPIEIKSPTEELFLSTKAIRQALENKVVLLARGSLHTNLETTCLIVGYRLPNERGDMSSLIDEIYDAFGIRIGVISISTLAVLAIRALTENMMIDREQLAKLRGYLNA